MHDFFLHFLQRVGVVIKMSFLVYKTKQKYHAVVSFLCYFFGSWGWGIQFNFQRNLKLITQDNYCMTRSAAMKYNPQVNVNNCV